MADAAGGGEETVLPIAVARNLSDKLYEKRKLGAQEIEHLVIDLVQAENSRRIQLLLNVLTTQFVCSSQPNARKGGLLGLSTSAIGLGDQIEPFLPLLFPPALKLLTDVDSNVRFFACESVYNIGKVARFRSLKYFNEVFDALCKLFADPDASVSSAAELVDRLFKDLVTENGARLEIEPLMQVLRPRIYVTHPLVRQFLLSWVALLHTVPGLNILPHLPDVLAGIFLMLSDTNKEVRSLADSLLGELLQQCASGKHQYDYVRFIRIPIQHITSKEPFLQHRALMWVTRFVEFGQEAAVPFVAPALTHTLPLLHAPHSAIRQAASNLNAALLKMVQKHAFLDVAPALKVCSVHLERSRSGPAAGGSVESGTVGAATGTQSAPAPSTVSSGAVSGPSDSACLHAALEWVSVLYAKMPEKVFACMDTVFPALLHTLSNSDSKIVSFALLVLGRISEHGIYFSLLITSLLKLFHDDRPLLKSRSSLVIRTLCVNLDVEQVFRAVANKLVNEQDLEFAQTMVNTLNLILLTAPELRVLRLVLADLGSQQSQELFTCLYRCWCHSPTSAVALCFLSGSYKHAAELVRRFGDMEISFELLLEVDKMIQLLESPIFTRLRLHLVQPLRYPHLCEALYGLLQLLPQSDAFHLLNNRLLCVLPLSTVLASTRSEKQPTRKKPGDLSDEQRVEYESLVKHFLRVQTLHSAARDAGARADSLRCDRYRVPHTLADRALRTLLHSPVRSDRGRPHELTDLNVCSAFK